MVGGNKGGSSDEESERENRRKWNGMEWSLIVAKKSDRQTDRDTAWQTDCL